MTKSRVTAAVVAAACLAWCGATSAQTKTWNFGDITAPGSCTSSTGSMSTNAFGNTISCSEQPSGTVNTLAVSAFSTATASGSSTTYQTAAVNYWGAGSGLGVANRFEGLNVSTSPSHAMDNSTPGIDMLLLSFSAAEVLKSVTLGWSGTDGDFQVLRWKNPGPVTLPGGNSAAQLLTAGWELVSSVNGAGGISTPDVSYAINGGDLSSSYWLISAYNSAFGGTNFTTGVDAIKVLAVTAQGSTGVPEPGSLALAGLALVGALGSRRRLSALAR